MRETTQSWEREIFGLKSGMAIGCIATLIAYLVGQSSHLMFWGAFGASCLLLGTAVALAFKKFEIWGAFSSRAGEADEKLGRELKMLPISMLQDMVASLLNNKDRYDCEAGNSFAKLEIKPSAVGPHLGSLLSNYRTIRSKFDGLLVGANQIAKESGIEELIRIGWLDQDHVSLDVFPQSDFIIELEHDVPRDWGTQGDGAPTIFHWIVQHHYSVFPQEVEALLKGQGLVD